MEGGIWFRHDADSSQDVRMIAMQARWDLQGIGAYWKFAEILRNNQGAIAKTDIEAVLISMRWDHAQEWFGWCLGRRLFEEDKTSIYSARMLREIKEYDEYKAKRHGIAVQAGLASGRARAQHPVEHDVEHPVEHKRTTRQDKTRLDKTGQDSKVKIPVQPDGWTEWWALYPRKVAKAAALKAYVSATKAGHLPKALKDGLSRSVTWWKVGGTEPQFIPHPATWLRQGRWDDEAPALPQAKDGIITAAPGKDYGKSGKW